MAYALQNNEDDEKDQQQEGGTPLGGESAVIGSGVQPGQNAPNQAATEKKAGGSGQYVNLQAYLNANQGRQFGQQVAGKLGGNVGEASEQLNTAETGFKSAADQGAVATNQALLDQLKTNPQGVSATDYKAMRDAQYKGPESFDKTDYYTPTDTKVKSAKEQAEASKSESGRTALLDQYYGSGAGRYDYSKGQKSLDNLLISADPNSKEAFVAAQDQAKQLEDRYGTLKDSLNQYAGQKKQETADTRAKARGALGLDESGNVLGFDAVRGNAGALQDLVESLDERSGQYKSSQDTAYADLLARLGTGTATAEQLQKTGLSRLEGAPVYNAKLADYVTRGMDPTRSSVATAQEREQLAALQQLADAQPFIDQSAKQYDPNQAYSYDIDRLNKVLGGEAAQRQDLLKSANYSSPYGYLIPQILNDTKLSNEQKMQELNKRVFNKADPTIEGAGVTIGGSPVRNLLDIISEQEKSPWYDPKSPNPAKQLLQFINDTTGYNKKLKRSS